MKQHGTNHMRNNNRQQSIASSGNGIVGVWERRYSFSLGMGGTGIINAIESYTFCDDGSGEYVEDDDSGIQDKYIERFTYRINGNKLIMKSEMGVDEDDFEISHNKLILIDPRYNYCDEFEFTSTNRQS